MSGCRVCTGPGLGVVVGQGPPPASPSCQRGVKSMSARIALQHKLRTKLLAYHALLLGLISELQVNEHVYLLSFLLTLTNY